MSFQKFRSNFYCVGGRRRSATTKNFGNITSEGSRVLIGPCSICDNKTPVSASDNTIQAEGLGVFFKNLGNKGLNVSKKMAKTF